MAIYGTPITMGGGGGSNDTLPPLLDNFKAKRLEGGIVPPTANTLAFKDIPDGAKIKLVKGSKISGTVTYGTTTDLNHRIVFDSNEWTRKRFRLENDSSHNNISGSDIDQWLNSTKASGWWTNQSTNTTSPDYANEQGFLYQLGITDELLAQNFNNIQINSESTAKVALPWRVSFSEDIPYTFFKDVTFLDVADYASLYGNSGNDVLVYNKPQTKAPSQITLYNVTAKIHPMMEPKPDTKVALDSDGSYFMFEKQTSIILSADKMPVSRANALAGAVWVYGEHIPQNKNDGTKIELTRDEVIKPDPAPFITLADIPVSDADTGTVVNLKESDGQLHPYLYLHNNYEGSGAGLLLRKDIYQVTKYNDSGTNIYENTTLDLWCENTFVAMLDSSVKSKLNSVSIPVRNGLDSTESTLDRQCFVLSSDELGVQTSAVIGSKLPYFNNDTRRIATYNTSNQGYFTRTMYSLGGIIVINGSGTPGFVTNNATTFGYRPAFCLPLTFQLNPTPNPDGSYDMYEESSVQTLATGKTIADLPSKSKVKLGRYGGKDLVWELTKDTSNQALRMILNASSMDIIGGKMFDNKEPSNPDSNRYIWSNLHQWLNSDKPANQWYAAQHKYDAPPNYTNINGFLYEWNESERNVLDSTNWTVTRHSADGGGSEVFQSRVTLPSTTEMGLNVNTGGGRLDIFNNDTDRKARLAYWCRTPHTGLAYNVLVVSNSGTEGASGGANNPNLLVRPMCTPKPSTLISNEPDSDGCYTIQIEPTTIERTISWDTNKNFYARQFTYNSKKQYQTILEGATAYLPIMPDGQELSKLPSKSKIKLGKVNNTVLKWIVCRDTSDNQVRLILDGSSYNVLGEKQFDAPEPSNSNSDRRSSGNNRYIWSNLHQWLNSNKPANQWYTSQHGADAPPNYANQNGFLNQWTEKEIKSLELANWTVTKSSVDGSGSETFRSRVTLASTTELGLESGTGGGRLDIMNSNGDRGLGNFYWCRTPHLSFADSVRGVNGVGSLYFERASYAFGVRPLCKPLSNILVSLEPDSEGCYTIV